MTDLNKIMEEEKLLAQLLIRLAGDDEPEQWRIDTALGVERAQPDQQGTPE